MAQEGLPLDIRVENEPVFRQEDLRDGLFDELRDDGPEWILPLDVDEFLVVPQGLTLAEALAELPTGRPCRLPWLTYVPTPDDDEREPNVLAAIRYRTPEARSGKVVLSRKLARDRRYTLSRGGHRMLDRRSTIVRSVPTDALSLAHFPVRSEAQLRVKVLGGWPCILADHRLRVGMASHWDELYKELSDGRPLAVARLAEIARNYELEPDRFTWDELVLDPLDVSFELRYPIELVSPAEVLALTAEGLAHALRALDEGQQGTDSAAGRADEASVELGEAAESFLP
jgi:hypothetical protein